MKVRKWKRKKRKGKPGRGGINEERYKEAGKEEEKIMNEEEDRECMNTKHE